MNYSHESPSEYSSTNHSLQTGLMIGQVVVTGPDNLMVSVARYSSVYSVTLITTPGYVWYVLLRSVTIFYSI